MMSIIEAHPTFFGIMTYWIFSAVVGGMPQPTDSSPMVYVWLHDSLHILAGNLTAAMASRYPQLPPGTSQRTLIDQTTNVPKEK